MSFKILLAGDTHIPDRADRIREVVLRRIEPEKPFNYVLFTGDLTSKDILEWLRTLGSEIRVVRGNMDYLPLPRRQVLEIENLKIGIVHGDGVYPRGDAAGLARISRELGTSILASGHTHSPFIKTDPSREILLLNPGSLTGVWGGGGGSMKPSFMILTVESGRLMIELYVLEDNVVKSRRYMAVNRNNSWNITQLEE
ncbi:MAG: YfcE family phosphodiesterase [Desulfurococcus sp.]|nr:YfcE family phosphodiesterase [Desulfurococcus sp.]